MKYAPIIIPTLNRYEHLKKCVESLKSNTYAKYTDLIISLDFPPSAKYADGYKKVSEYLDGGISGFNNVKIIRQKENLGAKKNSMFLVDYALKNYGMYIFSEDDNEYAPAFLEFVDKSLQKYRNDDGILGVCGFSYPIALTENDNTVYASNQFNAFGYAIWEKERIWFENNADGEYFKKKLRNLRAGFRCAKYVPFDYWYILDCTIKGEEPINGDALTAVFAVINNKQFIFPKKSLVKNNGFDGTGEHWTEGHEHFSNFELDNSREFVLSDKFDIPSSKAIAAQNKALTFDFLGRFKLYVASLLYSVGGVKLLKSTLGINKLFNLLRRVLNGNKNG